MAILKTEEERRRYEELRRLEAAKPRELPRYLKEPVNVHVNLFDRFTARWIIEGKEVELLISPEPGNKLENGYPSLYGITITNFRHYGWLTIKDGNWKWFSGEQPVHIAEEIGGILIVAHYQ